jgi:hypothetical protein
MDVMKNKSICFILIIFASITLAGEIIDYMLEPLPSGESEERVLVEKNQVKEYLKSLDNSLSQAKINNVSADSFSEDKQIMQSPVEVVTIHSSSDSLFIKERTNFLEGLKRDYKFSREKRIKENIVSEMARTSVLGTIILIQTVYFPYRYLMYKDKPANLLSAGTMIIIDVILLMTHWQGTQQIYKE